ncbi:MAG: hypothetical protein R2774_00970 [Saprospiraceae bacterium]
MFRRFLIVMVVFGSFYSCKNDKRSDEKSQELDTNVIDVYKLLTPDISTKDFDAFVSKYPAFSKLYFNQILPLGLEGSDSISLHKWQEFSRDSGFVALTDKVLKMYPNSHTIQKDLKGMYGTISQYFPTIKSANIYPLISEFGYQTFNFEDDNGKEGIGISLDMYLGHTMNYKMIAPDNTNFSDYITRSWDKDHIARKVVNIYIEELLGPPAGHRMLDLIIHNGKALYLAQTFLPEAQDSVIIEFTQKQLDWCRNSELAMWSFFVDNNLFYESNPSKIGKYVYPAPSSPNMPPESPGRTGNYIGWQIVRAYMERYPDTTLDQLIQLKDSQLIMEKSKYKPKQK